MLKKQIIKYKIKKEDDHVVCDSCQKSKCVSPKCTFRAFLRDNQSINQSINNQLTINESIVDLHSISITSPCRQTHAGGLVAEERESQGNRISQKV